MKRIRKYEKTIAVFLLLLILVELVAPLRVYALTSGPSQPEMKGFEPIGNSDMVDLFSGDFSYNIPLLDVGGYPVNLAYHSGAGMDDEASWTGYGWNINVGSLNRQLRGIPDDFNGSDKQEREMTMKEHVTKGGRFAMTLDLLGIPVSKVNKKKKKRKLNTSLTVSAGVKFDNYRGVGVELGANAGASLTEYVAGEYTLSGKDEATGKSLGLPSIGLNLSSFDGASLSLNANILRKKFDQNDKSYSVGKSIGLGYNSRAGLTGLTMKSSFSSSGEREGVKIRSGFESGSSSFISFNGDTYTPTIDHATENNSYTLSVNVGPELWFAYLGLGVTGFYSKQNVKEKKRISPAYGYLASEAGKDINDALLDFNREKDIPYNDQINYLSVPVPTYDLFTASSQDGGGQYRLYRGSSGVFFDQKTGNSNTDLSLGVEFGAGAYFDVGADLYVQNIQTVTQKWRDRNNFLTKGDFQGTSTGAPLYEPAYFKRVGEPVPNDNVFITRLKGVAAAAVQLPAAIPSPESGALASDLLRTKNAANGETIATLKRDKREVRNTSFSYLTAKEAANHGLDKNIKDYHPDSLVLNNCNTAGIKHSFQRTADYRKLHHLSEITITGDDGKRSVYGIPVYNTYQEEVSFSTGQNLSLRNKGLISYTEGVDNSTANNKGLENYYSKEKTPPYATAYLLTSILSPDYVDKTGNGITDDDPGTAVKFNYSRLDNVYKWRTPFALGKDTANYNEGFLSDPRDDKANYVYGQKEVWYLHSIESKTMVAHFITGDRQDALGVLNSRGEADTTHKLKYLKEIRLYSKSDLQLNGNDPSKTIPIKVVHLEYDYSLCRGLPNSINKAGKLTLKKVYFTFGNNQKGRLNPYEFSYDTSYNYYSYRQYDRWGNYKNADDNPGGLNNSEFPYTLQDTSLTNAFARAWQLKQIILPSGGAINISYESDDYAYVQDKRASQMCFLQGVNTSGSSSGLIDADYIYVNLPYPVSSRTEMLERYFEGVTNLYYKCFMDLDAQGHKEFVPGYAKIIGIPELVGTNVAKIRLEKTDGVNSIAQAGWQFLRVNLPRYAYPGSDNLDDNRSDLKKIITALVTAFGTIKELIYGFESRAKAKGFCNTVDLSKSWVRLCSPAWKKLGGGSRVRRIDISDDWAVMSGATGARTATYSQLYDYTTKDVKGRMISSGVASYEPMLGNDENPWRQPIRYKQNQILGLDNYFYIEEPFCESLFPGASVGYSKVTVKSIGSGDDISVDRTGTTVSEFHTSKDYPVKLDILNLQKRKPSSSKILKLIGGISYEILGLSQGYAIELNDMHGKPKSVNVYNKAGQNISSVEYFYQSENEMAEKKTLRNNVKLIASNGVVSDGSIGMDVELFTDMRQQTTNNLGASTKVSGGAGSIFWVIPLPFGFPGFGVNNDVRSYRAASTIKIIQRFGIQYKVRKMENGSSITTENLLWDAETGNVLLTKTQNEFDDPVYSFAYPAHWVYNGMGQAYQNLGTVFSSFSTGSNGQVLNAVYNNTLVPGDELIDINSANKYWIINSPVNSVYQKRLVDSAGNLKQVTALDVKLLRSGRRNMANSGIATITSLNNPIVGDRLDISQLSKVLDAKATVFNEVWSMPVSSVPYSGSTGGQCTDPACLATFINAALCTQIPQESKKNIFASSTDSLSAGSVMKSFIGQGGNLLYGNCFDNFGNGLPADSLNYYLHVQRTTTVGCTRVNKVLAGDTATLGNCIVIFDSVNNSTAAITDYNNYMDIKPAGYTPPCTGVLCNTEGFRVVNDSCGFTIKKVRVIPSGGCYRDSVLYTIFKIHTVCSPVTVSGCQSPVGGIFNPYYTGILGNWRAQAQYAYQVSRETIKNNPALLGNTNIRKSGAYSVFNPFWKYNYTTNVWQQNPATDNRWIAANEVIYFNSKGVEIENRDALNRYSAAVFGYLESLPVAVASNARYREIGYDGFEDYGFNVDCTSSDSCNNSGHFSFRRMINGTTVSLSSQYAHSGKYSLHLDGTVALQKTVFLGNAGPLYDFYDGKYLLRSNELAKGFSPVPGKRYVLSFWVKDGSPRDASTSVQAVVNGNSLISNATKWPIVEGWKRVELSFTLPSVSTGFTLQLQSGAGAVYIDDIRIHPFDGQLKSFAYDASSQRLWAELDENNFATFYEYDDEGILIRVKKETERGIMTIKETRSSYRKRQ